MLVIVSKLRIHSYLIVQGVFGLFFIELRNLEYKVGSLRKCVCCLISVSVSMLNAETLASHDGFQQSFVQVFVRSRVVCLHHQLLVSW